MTQPQPEDYIAGYLTHVEFTPAGGSLVDVDGFAASAALQLSRSSNPKPAFGFASQAVIGGQRSGQLTVAGHASHTKAQGLWDAWQADSCTFTIETNPGDATKNVKYTFAGVITQYAPSTAEADGEVEFDLTADVSGDVTFTPPAP